jgi:transcriptional regulator
MYIPPAYQETDPARIRAFVTGHSFGVLVSKGDRFPMATHIPLEWHTENGVDYLVGHIAKANAQWHDFKKQPEVLAIFQGPHSYVSSSWYENEEVPTWNYIAAHIQGRLIRMDDTELMEHMVTMVNKYEAIARHPVDLQKMSPKTLKQIRGVVGFKIKIEKCYAASKLSQTRSTSEQETIVDELRKLDDSGSQGIADAMDRL